MSGNGSWRYQIVYVEHSNDDGDKSCVFSICEIYLDKYGKLEAWTENPQMKPYGETLDELIGDLQMMLDDAHKWEPVSFSSLKTGMTFKRMVHG